MRVTDLTVEEEARLKRLDVVVWNYLGERDPEKVGAWIAGACAELAYARPYLEEAYGRGRDV